MFSLFPTESSSSSHLACKSSSASSAPSPSPLPPGHPLCWYPELTPSFFLAAELLVFSVPSPLPPPPHCSASRSSLSSEELCGEVGERSPLLRVPSLSIEDGEMRERAPMLLLPLAPFWGPIQSVGYEGMWTSMNCSTICGLPFVSFIAVIVHCR